MLFLVIFVNFVRSVLELFRVLACCFEFNPASYRRLVAPS
jgi:hypothetical protein